MTKYGIKDIALGRSDIFRLSPHDVHVKEGWNVRDPENPENAEHLDTLARSIAEVGVKEPLTVYWEDGKAYVSDGHFRRAAALRAIEVYGAELKSVPVKTEDRYAGEADRILSQDIRNGGKPLSPYERGRVYKKLADLGWEEKDIAAKTGRSIAYVQQLLSLQAAPEAVQSLVRTGKVSASLASAVTRESGGGEAATKKLTEAVETAKAAGKTRATRKHLPRQPRPVAPTAAPPEQPAIAVSLVIKLASLAVHVEEMLSVGGHPFDQEAAASILADPEVRAFLDDPRNAALLPLKRRAAA